jgi:hypothetical protein
MRWRKEPCDSQQRNKDQDANRKIIDHDRTFSQQLVAVCSQWQNTKRKRRCQCHACDGQSQNYGYHGNPLYQLHKDCQNRIARTGQRHP